MVMNFFNETPLLRFLIFLISGILCAIYFPILNQNLAILICLFLLIVLLFQHLTRKRKHAFKLRWITGFSTYLFSFLIGYSIAVLNAESNYADHFRTIKEGSAYIGYLEEPPIEKSNSYKTVLKITSVKKNDSWISSTGNCLVYFPKDSLASQLRYGDLIIFSEKPTEVKLPTNPSQFNYKNYLSHNKIYDQVYIPSDSWSLLAHHQGYFLYDVAFSLREKLLNIFQQNGIKGQDYAVLSAIVLGYRDEIDRETMSAYVSAGVVHVIVVAGLHVGIIYLFLNFVLMFLERKRWTRILKAILIILILGFYALLTGLSPSVLRATTMLIFIIGGKASGRYTNSYNTLAASAFFLLCCNPYMLLNSGFQLSYIAVIGIVALYQRIYQWIDVDNRILREAWRVVAVSIAAQLATFPLCLLYFHQFPSYFLLANLAVTILLVIIMWGGILLLLTSWWQAAASALGFIIAHLVHFLNSIVSTIEHLPHAMLRSTSISVFETALIYLFLFLTVAWLVKKNATYLLSSLGAVCLLFTLWITKAMSHREQQYFVVYDVPKQSAINFIDGKQNILIADSSLTNNKNLMNYNINSFWWDCGLNENNVTAAYDSANNPSASFYSTSNCFLFNNTRFIRINKTPLLTSENSVETDYVILSGNVKGKLKELLRNLKPKRIIIDSSNSKYKAAQWMREAQDLKLLCYSVPHSGAFVTDCKRVE